MFCTETTMETTGRLQKTKADQRPPWRFSRQTNAAFASATKTGDF